MTYYYDSKSQLLIKPPAAIVKYNALLTVLNVTVCMHLIAIDLLQIHNNCLIGYKTVSFIIDYRATYVYVSSSIIYGFIDLLMVLPGVLLV